MTRRSLTTLVLLFLSACDSRGPVAPTVPTTPSPVSPSPPSPARPGGPDAISGMEVKVGTVVSGTIDGRDPVCYPNWDSSGRCRQFDLTAPADGTLHVTLTWEGPSRGIYDPELFLGTVNGSWMYSEDLWPERHARILMTAGAAYRIVVIAYGPAQPFELRLDLQP